MRVPLFPGQLCLLLLLLLLPALLEACARPRFLQGIPSHLVPNPPQHRVNGTLGGSVLLPVSVPPGTTVAQIEWVFRPESGQAFMIAELSDGEWERPIPTDRFQPRLEKVNETTLRINNLVKNDSGVYTAHVRFGIAEVQEQTFLLQVSGEKELSWNWKYLLLVPFIILVSYTLVWLKVQMKPRVKKAPEYLPCQCPGPQEDKSHAGSDHTALSTSSLVTPSSMEDCNNLAAFSGSSYRQCLTPLSSPL